MNIHVKASSTNSVRFRDGGVDLFVADVPTAAALLRVNAFRDTASVSTIPSVKITADDGCGDIAEDVEAHLAAMMLDLGNSSGDNVVGMVNALQNPHATEPKHDALSGIAAGREVICLASGPSAGPLLPTIATRQRMGAIVVCADSIYRGAVAAGIQPDFVCVLERDERMADMVPPDLCERTRLICPAVVHPLVAAGWDGRRVWVWQSASLIYDAIGSEVPRIGTGRSAGTLAVMVSALMRPMHLLLVGHDLCEIGSSSHAAAAESAAHVSHVHDVQNPSNTYHRRSFVRCYDGLDRISTLFWQGCRADIEAILARVSFPVYAMCDQGARIRGANLSSSSVVVPVSGRKVTIGTTSPSRYNQQMIVQLIDECRHQLARLAHEPPEGDETTMTSLVPSLANCQARNLRILPLIQHVTALDLMALNLRAHRDSASGLGRAASAARSYRLLRRRLPQSIRYALHALEAIR